MNRRDFLLACPALAGAPAALSAAAADDLDDVKITRVVGFDHECPRPRVAGKNARLGVHGKATRDGVLRIETDADNIERELSKGGGTAGKPAR